jgi:hypothetical protein
MGKAWELLVGTSKYAGLLGFLHRTRILRPRRIYRGSKYSEFWILDSYFSSFDNGEASWMFYVSCPIDLSLGNISK